MKGREEKRKGEKEREEREREKKKKRDAKIDQEFVRTWEIESRSFVNKSWVLYSFFCFSMG